MSQSLMGSMKSKDFYILLFKRVLFYLSRHAQLNKPFSLWINGICQLSRLQYNNEKSICFYLWIHTYIYSNYYDLKHGIAKTLTEKFSYFKKRTFISKYPLFIFLLKEQSLNISPPLYMFRTSLVKLTMNTLNTETLWHEYTVDSLAWYKYNVIRYHFSI